jgi:hypothetical protein
MMFGKVEQQIGRVGKDIIMHVTLLAFVSPSFLTEISFCELTKKKTEVRNIWQF